MAPHGRRPRAPHISDAQPLAGLPTLAPGPLLQRGSGRAMAVAMRGPGELSPASAISARSSLRLNGQPAALQFKTGGGAGPGRCPVGAPPHTPAPAGPPGQAIETKDGRDSGTPSETRVMVLHSVHGSSSCDMNTVLGGNGWEAQWEHEDAYARRTRTAVWAGGRARHESLQSCLLPLSGARLRLVRFLRLSAPPWGPSEPTPGRWNRTSTRSMGTRKS